jgi:hypothetical protein
MKLFVGVTENQWFDFLRRLSDRYRLLEQEVSSRPSRKRLFLLDIENNYVVNCLPR